MRASTATQPCSSPSTGLRSSSATSGRSSASRARRSTRSTSARLSDAGCPRKPATSVPGLAGGDELLGVDVGERREPEPRLADQLCEDAAGAERDERPEDGILDDAGEQLRAALHHRLHEHREPDPLDRRAHRLLVLEVERDASRLGLVRARGGGLHDDRIAELGGCLRLRRRRCRRPARARAGSRRRSSSARASAGVEPGVGRRRRASAATISAAAAWSIPSQLGHGSGRPAQPLGALRPRARARARPTPGRRRTRRRPARPGSPGCPRRR